MNKAKKSAVRATATEGQDAIAMLVADHKKARDLFKQFSKLKGTDNDEDKAAVVMQVCSELRIHMQIEEEIFYPAVEKAISDDDLMDEATVEHAGARDLIEQLEAMSPGDHLYDAKVTVLGELIEHHVKEEEGEMFPRARKTKLDMTALGAEMMSLKEELKSEMDLSDEGREEVGAVISSRKETTRGLRGSAVNGK